MPRPNRNRQLFAEEYLARRILMERERRGWTYEGLAKRMGEEGCSVAPSAIYKIEKGDPPRKITVDELVALSRVFQLSMAELVMDPAELVPAQAAELMEKVEVIRNQYFQAMILADRLGDEYRALQRDLDILLEEHPDAAARVKALTEARQEQMKLRNGSHG